MTTAYVAYDVRSGRITMSITARWTPNTRAKVRVFIQE